MNFTGFPVEALDFYEGLESDNTKTYWTEHKQTYEQCVRAPMLALCEVLEQEFGAAHLFRPYRDVRFSRNRGPYKEQQGALVGHRYVHLSAAGLFAATGYHQMNSDQVERYREAVADDRSGPDVAEIVAALRAKKYTVGGDELKTRPRGYPPDHPRIDLLRKRALVAWVEFGAPRWLHTANAADRVAKAWRDMAPLARWLDENVGPSTQPMRR